MTDLRLRGVRARLLAVPWPAAIRRAGRSVSLYYPFTLAGSLLLVSGAALLAVGFTRSNVYALLLAVFALLILALLAALGRIQAIRFQRVQVRWDSSQTLIAHRRGLSERVLVERVRTFLFFRLHVRIRGKLQVGRDAHLGISREIATIGGGAADIPLDLPLSGLLASRGSTAVRDVFGLSRSRFGEVYQITRPVLPESVRELERLPISATGGNEEQNRKAQVDEEKYFMREYIPGDRARDINWKASSRLNQLITRISPYTQERSKVIRIELRPYRRPRQESLDSVMHLNRLKARLVSFLRAVKHEHPEYTFEIHCGETRWMVQAEEQIEALARDLAGLFYRPDAGSHPAPAGGQLVIFSTPFDEGLRAALPSYPKTVLHVITTTEPDPRRREEAEREPLYRSIFQRGRIDLPVPGRWALRRERARSSLGKALPAEAGITGTVTEEPIAVTLFEES